MNPYSDSYENGGVHQAFTQAMTSLNSTIYEKKVKPPAKKKPPSGELISIKMNFTMQNF